MPARVKERSAIDALQDALRVSPEETSRGFRWRDVTACRWRSGWLRSYELEETDELIVALHTGGSKSVRARIRGRWSSQVSNPGHAHVIPSGVATAFMPNGELQFTSVHIATSRVRAVLGDDAPRQADVGLRFAFHDSFVTACIQALSDEMRSPREHGPLFVDSVTDALVLHLLRRPAPVESRPGAEKLPKHVLARICERIDASLETGVSLDALASEAGYSRFHFARAFREAIGVPPHRYLTMRRIERAKELLRNTDLPLSEIALAAGFSSQSHFTLRFRDAVGETPRSFRRQEPHP